MNSPPGAMRLRQPELRRLAVPARGGERVGGDALAGHQADAEVEAGARVALRASKG